MSEQQATQQNATQPLIQERCLCRELVNQFREAFDVSPKVREHFTNSRIEFLKGIRKLVDDRIEKVSRGPHQKGSRIVVE